MSSYLDSLVPKTIGPTTDQLSSDDVIEQVEHLEEDLSVSEAVAMDAIVTKLQEGELSEEAELSKEPSEEPVVDAAKPEEALSLAPEPAANTSSTIYTEGETIAVKHIRIYKSPDTNQVAKMYSGNVIYLGRIEEFSVINCMKHGFGLVKGYTLDL